MSLFLMVTHGTAGDILQLIDLGRCLRHRGHEVVLLTHAPYAPAAGRAGISFVPIDSDAGYERHLRDTPDLLALRKPTDLRAFYERGGILRQTRREVDELVARHRPGETVLLGRHGSALSVLMAAELSGTPSAWVALYPSQLMTAPIFEYMTGRGLGEQLNAVRAEVGLAPLAEWRPWFRSTTATLALWPRWFDAAGDPAPAGVTVTGFLPGDPTDVFAADAGTLLADANTRGPTTTPDDARPISGATPPILITGGTGRMLHPDFYQRAIDAAVAARRPALVVTAHRDLLPDPLPAGVSWTRQAPFPEVFPGASVIVHHGGIGTCMSALRAGTPQVILAHGLDRPDNAGRLARLGLARWEGPANWSGPVLADHLQHAIADSGYPARAARTIAADDPALAAATAGAALEALLTPSTMDRVPK